MDNTICISGIVMGVICAFIGGSISSSKGRSYGEGFALGFLLGIIGLIIVAVLPKNDTALEESKLTDGTSKKCPYCAEIVKREAVVCKHCGRDLPIQEIQQEIEQPIDPVEIERRRVERLGIEVAVCPNCKTVNSLSLLTCEKCNKDLSKVKPIRNPYI